MDAAKRRSTVTYNIVLLGDFGVGKTTFLKQLSNGVAKATEDNSTYDTCTVVYKFEDETVTLKVWDTGGCEQYRSLPATYYRRADAAICIYSETKPLSRIALQEWIKLVRDIREDAALIAIVENLAEGDGINGKSKEKDIAISDLADEYGIPPHLQYHASAISKQQVGDVFRKIAREIHSSVSEGPRKAEVNDTSIVLNKHEDNRKHVRCNSCRRRQ